MTTAAVRTVRAKRSASAGSAPRPQPEEDRDERRREPRLDQDVEQQLGQHERGVVGVELRADAEGAREDAVADQPQDVAAEDERREEGRAARQEPPREIGQAAAHRVAGGAAHVVLGAAEPFRDRVQDAVAHRRELVHERVEFAMADDEQLRDPSARTVAVRGRPRAGRSRRRSRRARAAIGVPISTMSGRRARRRTRGRSFPARRGPGRGRPRPRPSAGPAAPARPTHAGEERHALRCSSFSSSAMRAVYGAADDCRPIRRIPWYAVPATPRNVAPKSRGTTNAPLTVYTARWLAEAAQKECFFCSPTPIRR